jgi:acyl-CoA reductase-like NAD-dependent aldehyde dehydrogenase
VISPWNFPFQLSLAPVISALVAGNSVILKPSEITPLVGKCIETIFKDIGFPDHVVQVAHGGKELGASLVQEKPDYIFFTGSVATGKKIQEEAARHLIPTTLELGGKDPMIVCADAHIERAVHAALWGGLTNSGQVCMSVERIYVQKEIAEKFTTRLVEEAKKIKRGFSAEDDFGSMTFQGQVELVKDHLQDALQKGATVLLGSDHIGQDMHLEPMILTDVNHTMKVMKEETFGPILPIQTFNTIEEAIELANDSEYGLNASVWSSNLAKAREITSQLISGNVVINDVLVSVGNHFLPFGGVKHSGIGRYHGDVGLQTFCHQTSVMIDSGKKKKEVNWYPYQGKYEIFTSLVQHFYGNRRSWIGSIIDYLRLLKR